MNEDQGTPAHSQRELDLARAETALSDEEARIMTRASDVVAQLSELSQTLDAFRSAIAQVQVDQPRNAEADNLMREFAGVHAPAIDADGHLDRTLVVREDALRARRWVVDSLRKDLERVERAAADVKTEVMLGEQRLRASQPQPPKRFPKTRRHSSGNALLNVQRVARAAPRVRMEADITMTSASNFFTGTSANISHGGVFVATNQQFKPGTIVKLAFRLPSGRAVESDGVVRWVRSAGIHQQPAGVGVSFRNLDSKAVEAIQEFIDKRDPIHFISSQAAADTPM